jgi:hypothetical protein
MFLRDGNRRKEKRLEYFAREPGAILLVDSNPTSEKLNPNNTVLVESMTEYSARKAAALAAGRPAPADTACLGIRALLQRIREDMASTGAVNVPGTLARLRAEASQAGYSTDTHGMYQYLMEAAAAEEAVERNRREAGLGGLLRRVGATSAVLRGKATTMEAAMMRGFRDPGVELGEDALLVRKYREAAARLSRPPG